MKKALAVAVLVLLVASLSATTGAVAFSWVGDWGIGTGALLATIPSVMWIWKRRHLIGDRPLQGTSDEAVGVSLEELLEDDDLIRRIDEVLADRGAQAAE